MSDDNEQRPADDPQAGDDQWTTDANESPDDRSDTETTMTDEPESEPSEDSEPEPSTDRSDLWRKLNYALLAGLALLALIATLQLYLNVSSAINQWITHEYRSLFQAAFNLVVLLLVSGGMVWQVRRLRE